MGNWMIQRSKMNVVRMLVTVVLMFALSWLPLHVLFLIMYFDPPNDNKVLQRINDVGVPLAQVLELSNSGMNAFIYSFFSGNFRRGFAHLCYCVLRKRKPVRGEHFLLFVSRVAVKCWTVKNVAFENVVWQIPH